MSDNQSSELPECHTFGWTGTWDPEREEWLVEEIDDPEQIERMLSTFSSFSPDEHDDEQEQQWEYDEWLRGELARLSPLNQDPKVLDDPRTNSVKAK